MVAGEIASGIPVPALRFLNVPVAPCQSTPAYPGACKPCLSKPILAQPAVPRLAERCAALHWVYLHGPVSRVNTYSVEYRRILPTLVA